MKDWYKKAVIYQIYPRSFFDTNNDGVGDLRGIIEKVDYLSFLGIDAVWLSPINTSPMHDFGYDISDYRGIDKIFGDMRDFDLLLKTLKKKKIKLLLDLVVNHTSHIHPWFIESRSSRNHPKRDWYIWHEGKNGKPPNNWLSVFGGSAWEWDSVTESYYLHSFLKEQPDLNWRNPLVKKAIFSDIEFWLKKGVNGFRLDVVNFYFKDDQLRNNPFRFWGWKYPRPYELQYHIYDSSRPEMHGLLKELRKLLNKYKAMSVGEVFVDFPGNPEKSAGYLGLDNELNLAFDFTIIHQKWNAKKFSKTFREWLNATKNPNWPVNTFNNHDQMRSTGRYEFGNDTDKRMKILATILLTMKGTPFLYYGEEIGMRNGKISRSKLQDPVGIRYWPIPAGRDGERTPMQWDNSPNAGFSGKSPWLPVNPDFADRNVSAQQKDTQSLLHWHKNLIILRKEYPALTDGNWSEIICNENIFAYSRETPRQKIDIFLNFSEKPQEFTVLQGKILISSSGSNALTNKMNPYEALLILRQ